MNHKPTYEELRKRVQELENEVLIRTRADDISERKKAEQALSDSEQRLQRIIQGFPIPAMVIGKDHRVVYWNRAWEELSQIPAADVIGTKEHWKTFYDHERPCLADLLVDEVSHEEILKWYEGECSKSDLLEEAYEVTIFLPRFGREGKWLHLTAALIRNSLGVTVGAIETVEDITERKLAAKKLERSEEKFSKVFWASPAAISLSSLKYGCYIDVNESFLKHSGYTREEVIGRSSLELGLWGPDARDRFVEVLKKEGRARDLEFEFRAKSGDLLTGSLSAEVIEIEGEPCALAIASDIGERKRAENELKESQQKLADIIDFLPDATFVIDREGKVIAWNRAIEEMSGIKATEMLGKDNYEYALSFYGERRPMLIDLVLAPGGEVEKKYHTLQRSGGLLTGLAPIPSLKGRPAYLFGTASALYDSKGNVVGAIESIRDITERRLMEEALAKAEAKYRDIFENSVTGIFQTTPDGRFLSVNAAIATMLGYDSTEEMIDSVIRVPQLYVHPERRSEMIRLIEEHGWVREFEAEYFKKDKSIIWVSLNIRAVRNSTGEVAYLEGTVSDITDAKLVRAQLEQALKMEAIGTLAGGIAHDFNNILTPIIGYTELALNSIPKDSRLSHNMSQILLSANRAKDLVNQILAFSRKTKQERKPVQVSLIVKEALKLIRSSLPTTIDIHQSLHEDAFDSTTMADPTQIHQVLMNLCTNAGHAMQDKGGTLTVTLENVEIGPNAIKRSTEMEPGPYLKLSVADTGRGIDEAIKQRIFDPYFTTKGPSEGTGLGLAVVYGIVKDLAGSVTVSSRPGKGTTFDVYFPRIITAPAPAAARTEPLPTGSGVVLVVDDEESIVDMMKEMLEALGYEAVPRYSSADALEAFRARPEDFDLVITDMTMPHMTGIDLANEILKIRPNIATILCTGFSDTVDQVKIKLLGIKALLIKPVSLRDLAVTVNKLLDRDRRPSCTSS